jgi:hypothetical protein
MVLGRVYDDQSVLIRDGGFGQSGVRIVADAARSFALVLMEQPLC